MPRRLGAHARPAAPSSPSLALSPRPARAFWPRQPAAQLQGLGASPGRWPGSPSSSAPNPRGRDTLYPHSWPPADARTSSQPRGLASVAALLSSGETSPPLTGHPLLLPEVLVRGVGAGKRGRGSGGRGLGSVSNLPLRAGYPAGAPGPLPLPPASHGPAQLPRHRPPAPGYPLGWPRLPCPAIAVHVGAGLGRRWEQRAGPWRPGGGVGKANLGTSRSPDHQAEQVRQRGDSGGRWGKPNGRAGGRGWRRTGDTQGGLLANTSLTSPHHHSPESYGKVASVLPGAPSSPSSPTLIPQTHDLDGTLKMFSLPIQP